EDLQGALALTGDRHADHPVPVALVELLGGPQEHEARRPLLEGPQGLADDGGLGARAPEPSLHGPRRPDQPPAPPASGGGPAPPDHGGEHDGLPLGPLPGLSEDVREHHPPLAAWMASQTRAEVTGISRFVTPSGATASRTALT